MEKKLIEHEVIVDKYTKITLSIPQSLDATELKALFTKANKLFSLSEIEIQSRAEGKPIDKFSIWQWTPEQVAFVREQIQNNISPVDAMRNFKTAFNKEIPYGKLYPKYQYEKMKLNKGEAK